MQQFRENQKLVVTKGLTLSEASRRLEGLTSSLDDARKKEAAATKKGNVANNGDAVNDADPVNKRDTASKDDFKKGEAAMKDESS